ncbi:unnamed protein product [Trifolium pratense]|uniref:Uncharacterized protein n=1 Tax=Trifolium pratense TaxID=57577 RepID=A0ACB0JVB9_TRIPR|nr:unnamed protein product [Trifolium pratense]
MMCQIDGYEVAMAVSVNRSKFDDSVLLRPMHLCSMNFPNRAYTYSHYCQKGSAATKHSVNLSVALLHIC